MIKPKLENIMKNNKKIYLLISLTAVICLFAASAVCSQFGGTEPETEAPILELQISDGPIFSEEDNACYYEVEAIAGGYPEPDIEFSLDDNVSLLSSSRVKVIIYDTKDSYTLDATAVNSEGSTTASMNLSWGCEEEKTEDPEDIEGEDEEEIIDTGNEEDSEEDQDQEEDEEPLSGEELFAPDLSIFVYEGPFYSPEDDVCYYIIGSELYGNPFPELTWSKNDSNSMPPDMTQVNLRRGETYTLVATATNSEGTATSTLQLSWGCDGGDGDSESDGDDDIASQDSGDSEDNVSDYSVPLVNSETGFIVYNTFGDDFRFSNDSNYIYIGEAGEGDRDGSIGFLSFDISSLAGVTVTEAELSLEHNNDIGNPSRYDNFYIGSMYWGPGNPGRTELDSAVISRIANFSSSDTDITFSSIAIVQEIQRAVDSGWDRFQMKIYFGGTTVNDDGVADGRSFKKDGSYLKIDYETE